MQKTKLTVRVEKELLEKAKVYAASNNTTLTDLIDTYLRHIPSQGVLRDAPIVKRISGSLSANVNVNAYQQHLDEKYGG